MAAQTCDHLASVLPTGILELSQRCATNKKKNLLNNALTALIQENPSNLTVFIRVLGETAVKGTLFQDQRAQSSPLM